MKSELTMDSMMCWPPYLTTLQVPQVLARNQAGLDRRLMFTTSNGIFLTSRARIVRSAKGQNLTGSSTGNIVIVSVPHIVDHDGVGVGQGLGLPVHQVARVPVGKQRHPEHLNCLTGAALLTPLFGVC